MTNQDYKELCHAMVDDFYDSVYTETTAADLRQIADKLDELNGVSDDDV